MGFSLNEDNNESKDNSQWLKEASDKLTNQLTPLLDKLGHILTEIRNENGKKQILPDTLLLVTLHMFMDFAFSHMKQDKDNLFEDGS